MSDPEVTANAKAFRDALPAKISANLESVEAVGADKLNEAYARLTSLQAWRTFVLEEHLSESILGFYSEAQNDGLTSIVLVATGLWRPSLKSLRSLIENVVQCLYYMDHPIEYRHWEAERQRPTFKYLFDYLDAHPDIAKLPETLRPVDSLRQTWKHLSTYVHASSREVRMTDDLAQTNIWKTSVSALGKWSTAQKSVLRDVNLLLLCLLAERAQGAAAKGLREALARVIPSGKDAAIRAQLSVRIVR